MKLTRILSLALLLTLSWGAMAQQQDNPVIFEIAGKPIYKSTFMKEFLKSVGKDSTTAPTACTYEKRKALEEYVNLYVNYQTRLADAYRLQFDTLRYLNKELNGYRTELAAPYLIDSASLLRILTEAYDRNHYAVHAAHILIKCTKNASPEDTLAAYNKAMDVYNLAIAPGADFGALALKYSQDPSASGKLSGVNDQRKGNMGDLGCFTVFDMMYPFESAAFVLKPGEVSLPTRTNLGYHIIKMIDKVPYFGKTDLQHIWVSSKNGDAGEKMIRDAYQQLKEGANFAKVVQNYSDDRSSAANGGLLNNVDMYQMPPEYVKVISSLTEGEYCAPFKTSFGWHIVRLVKKESIGTIEDMVPRYKQNLVRDSRNNSPRKIFAQQCRAKYGFVDYTKTYAKQPKKSKRPQVALASLDQAAAAMNDSVFRKKWQFRENMVTDLRPLFRLGNRTYNTRDFLLYIESNPTLASKGDYSTYVAGRYEDFANDMAIQLADSLLETEHPEFKELMEEYRNGLMIFAYNDKMVWSKAVYDTIGRKAFYDRESVKRSIDNADDAPYFWNTRAQVVLVQVADSACLKPAKARKAVAKCQKKNMTTDEIVARIKKMASSKDTTITPVLVNVQIVEENNQNLLHKEEWQRGVYMRTAPKGYSLIVVNKISDPCLKSVDEARGYYINDYQNYLDAELMKVLRAQFNVMIHQDVVDQITY